VTTLVCYLHHRTRGCGCSGHPAFPTPSKGDRFVHNSGALRRGNANVYLELDTVIARSVSDEAIQTRNLEIPGSMRRIAPE
jgi:hypothetical protein